MHRVNSSGLPRNHGGTALIVHRSAGRNWKAEHRRLPLDGAVTVLEANGDLEEISAWSSTFSQSVVVVDSEFMRRQGDGRIRAFLRNTPAAHLLVFAAGSDGTRVDDFLLMGASGLLFEEPAAEVWSDILLRVPKGDMWVDRSVLVRAFRTAIAYDQEPVLSGREREVLLLLAEGLSNKSVAERMFVTPATIRWHLRKLYARTGITGRRQLMAYAVRCIRSGSLKPGLVKRTKPAPKTMTASAGVSSPA